MARSSTSDRGPSGSVRERGVFALVAGLAGGAVHAALPATSGAWGSVVVGLLAALGAVLPLAWTAGLAAAVASIEVVDGVPGRTMLAVQLAPLSVAALRCRMDAARTARRAGAARRAPVGTVARLALLLTLLVALRSIFAIDRVGVTPSLKYLAVSGGFVVIAAVGVGWKRLAMPVAVGHLVGVTISGAVSLLQASDRAVFRDAMVGESRYPGLSREVPQLSWQLAAGLVIGVVLFADARNRRWRPLIGIAGLICAGALVSCGGQGGVVGLALAGAVSGAIAWRRGRGRGGISVRPAFLVVATGVLLVVVAIASVTGAGFASLAELGGSPEKGYANELARADGLRDGLRALRDHPWTGPGFERFDAEHATRPHVYPLYVGLVSGVAGVLLALAVLGTLGRAAWRSARQDHGTVLWIALAVLFLTEAFVMTTGAFEQLGRTVLLFAAAAGLDTEQSESTGGRRRERRRQVARGAEPSSASERSAS